MKKKGEALILMLAVTALLLVLSVSVLTVTVGSSKLNVTYDTVNRVNLMAESAMDKALGEVKLKNSTVDIPLFKSDDGRISAGATFRADPNDASKLIITATAKCGNVTKTITKTLNQTITPPDNNSPFLDNTINSIGNSSASLKFDYGNIKSIGSVSIKGSSVTLNSDMNVTGNLQISSAGSGGITINHYNNGINVTGDTIVKCPNGPFNLNTHLVSSGNFIAETGGDITMGNYNRSIGKSAYFKTGGAFNLNGPLNVSGDSTIIANKQVTYGNYSNRTKGNTYVKSTGSDVALNSNLDMDGTSTFIAKGTLNVGNYNISSTGPLYVRGGSTLNLNDPLTANDNLTILSDSGDINFGNYTRKILGSAFIKAGGGISFQAALSMSSPLTMIANKLLQFGWYNESFTGSTFLKSASMVSFNQAAQVGNAYLEAPSLKYSSLSGNSINVYGKLSGGTVTPSPNVLSSPNVEPQAPSEPQEPAEPGTPADSSNEINSPNQTSDITQFDTTTYKNIAYLKIDSGNSNFVNTMKYALNPNTDVGSRYKLIILTGSPTLDYRVFSNDTTIGNYVVYCTGNLDLNLPTRAKLTMNNSTIYSKQFNTESGTNFQISSINSNPSLPFTQGMLDDINSCLSGYISNFTPFKANLSGNSSYSD